jgi:hypothetical protein
MLACNRFCASSSWAHQLKQSLTDLMIVGKSSSFILRRS